MPQPPREVDRRVARTRLALRNAMLALLPASGWDDLSIQAICEQADVGRSTFYLHYQGKDDLLSDSFAGLRDHLAAQRGPSAAPGLGMLGGLLDHMAEQRAVFKAVIGQRGGHGIASRFKAMVRELVDLELKRRGLVAEQRHWLASYLAGGIVETMAWWIDAPRPPSVREMERRINLLAEAAITMVIDPETPPRQAGRAQPLPSNPSGRFVGQQRHP